MGIRPDTFPGAVTSQRRQRPPFQTAHLCPITRRRHASRGNQPPRPRDSPSGSAGEVGCSGRWPGASTALPSPPPGPMQPLWLAASLRAPLPGPPARLSSYPTHPWRQVPTCPPCPGAANCLGCHGPRVSLAHWFPFGSYWLTAQGFPTVPAETRGRSASSRQRSSLGVLKTPPEKQST